MSYYDEPSYCTEYNRYGASFDMMTLEDHYEILDTIKNDFQGMINSLEISDEGLLNDIFHKICKKLELKETARTIAVK